MTDPELVARLRAIEDRLSALERRGPHERAAAVPPPPPPVPPAPTAPPAREISAPAPTAPPPAPDSHPAASAPGDAPLAPPSPFAPAPPLAPTGAPANLERFLGVQAAAWVGAIVVIVAIAIFAKFAIDQGWFQRTPPAAKLALAYALSAAFLVAGSLLRERVGRLPSVAMLAAGVGGLFVSTCAGITPLNVLGPVAALVVGVGVAVAGGAITLRSREIAVGAISLLGAYVVPVFAEIFRPGTALGESAAITGALYLTGVYAVALALARLGPAHFTWLRLAGVLQAISGFLLLIGTAADSPAISLAFTALWWAMAVAECSLAAMRGASPRFNTAVTLAATSVGSTLALRGAFATSPWTDPQSWLPLGMAGAAVAGAIYLRGVVPAGGVDARDREEDPEAAAIASACARQSLVLLILAGALVVAQVGVVVRGGALPVTWTIMGAAAILIARRLDQPWSARLGVLSTLLGLFATVIHAAIFAVGAVTLVEYPSDPALRGASAWHVRFTDVHWAPVIVAFGVLFAARFWSSGRDHATRPPLTAGFLAACASLLWIGLALSTGFSYATVVILLAIPAAAMLAGRTLSLIKLIGLLGSSIAAFAWFAATLRHVAENEGTANARPNGGVIAAALVVAGFLILGKRFRAEKFGEIPAATGFGFGLAALATLILVERLAGPGEGSVQLAITWAAMAVAVVATASAVAARKSSLQLSTSLGLIATGLSCGVILCAALVNAANPGAEAPWIWHWLLTPVNLALVALAACGLVIRGTFPGDLPTRDGVSVCAAAGFLVGSATLVYRFFDPRVGAPFETTRVIQQSALSVWLAIAAVLFVIHGFRFNARGARWAGLTLLGLVAAKVLVLDMAGAATIWRVAALLATGLLLVATSTVYTRASKAAAKTAVKPAEPPSSPA